MLKLLLAMLCLMAIAAAALWLFGAREPVETAQRFDDARLTDGVDAYLANAESGFDDITPGVQKQVVWAGAPETRTPVSILYVHGFSATSQEVRPVPDTVARALGANLVFTRLAGHGRGSAAMAEPSVGDWMADMAEGLAVARAVGDRVFVIGTSTGASLATLALHEDMGRGIAGVVMISPNFRVKNPLAALITWPGARVWLPMLAGKERSFEPRSDANATYWTTRYPSAAVFPMGAAVKAAFYAPHGETDVPALFLFDENDQVVDHRATRQVASRWGGPVTVSPVGVGPGDDAFRHVIAGDILSPGMTAPVSDAITAWIQGQL